MLSSEEANSLATAVGKGDRQAFAVLFDHFAPRVAAYLRRGGTPPPVADELAQEAMVMLWRKAGAFDPARGALSTWIFAVARHLRIDSHRHQGADLSLDFDFELDDCDLADPSPLPDERLTLLERERRVRAALKQLSPQQAHLLHLSFFAESPHDDISRAMHLPLGTVKSQIRRALTKMRRLLEAQEP